jgi:murein DD-endopeptidase MepM/ murein hydrolase activator NlpD
VFLYDLFSYSAPPHCHPCEGRDPGAFSKNTGGITRSTASKVFLRVHKLLWIPAFAGMTRVFRSSQNHATTPFRPRNDRRQLAITFLLAIATLLLTACTSHYEPAPVEIHRPGEFIQGRPGPGGAPQFLAPEVPGSSPLNPVHSTPSVAPGRIQVKSLDPLPGEQFTHPQEAAHSFGPAEPPVNLAPPAHEEPAPFSHVAAEPPLEIAPEPAQGSTEEVISSGEDVSQAPQAAPEQVTIAEEAVVPAEPAAPTAPPASPKAAQSLAPTPQALLATPGLKFLWPANGSVVTGFGPTDDGLRNDGINITLPSGTPVRCAEAGKVVFVGEKVKGFGKLVLVTHAQGWSSAYAHLDKVNVKKGQTIKRGQVLAFSGQSGTIKTPQLHFELRQGVQAVDPTPYLEH